MFTQYAGNELYVEFSGSPSSGLPRPNVIVGPFAWVEQRVKGLWAGKSDGSEPVLLATQDGVCWQQHGTDGPLWGGFCLISPHFPTTADHLMAATGWRRGYLVPQADGSWVLVAGGPSGAPAPSSGNGTGNELGNQA